MQHFQGCCRSDPGHSKYPGNYCDPGRPAASLVSICNTILFASNVLILKIPNQTKREKYEIQFFFRQINSNVLCKICVQIHDSYEKFSLQYWENGSEMKKKHMIDKKAINCASSRLATQQPQKKNPLDHFSSRELKQQMTQMLKKRSHSTAQSQRPQFKSCSFNYLHVILLRSCSERRQVLNF